MHSDDLRRPSRRTMMALAASGTLLPTVAARAQTRAPSRPQSQPPKALADLDVGPVEWRNIRTDFGAIGNGTQSDFPAFRAFRNWAMAQKGWVGLVIPPSPGHYVTGGPYAAPSNGTAFFGIKKLVVYGYGAAMDGLFGSAITNHPSIRHKIRSVKAGSRTVELIDRASVRFLSPGSMVLLAGFDLQAGWGYPPNSHFQEYHRIASIKEWRITFEKPIKYDYRDDWPRHFEGNHVELGGIGAAAICRTNPGWDCEHRIYGLRSVAPGQTYYFVRKATLVDVKSDSYGWIIGASEDHRIIGQQHTETEMEVDKLTTKALVADYGPANKRILIQSSSVDEMEVRGGTRSIIGTARHMLIHKGSSSEIRLGPVAYGISDRITIRDHVVTGAIIGQPGLADNVTKFTFKKGVLRYAGSGFPSWFVPGAVGIIRSVSPYCDHHVFKVLSVRSETGNIGSPILIETNMKGDELPKLDGLANLALVRHNAPDLTVTNCTGCPTAEELSLAPPNSPYGAFRRRTIDGSATEGGMGYLMGRLVRLKINVVRPYSGVAPALHFRFNTFGMFLVNANRTVSRPRISVDLRTAGERIITPDGVVGSHPGDSNLSAFTGGVWMPGTGFGYSLTSHVKDEDPSVRPIVVVEALTNQEF